MKIENIPAGWIKNLKHGDAVSVYLALTGEVVYTGTAHITPVGMILVRAQGSLYRTVWGRTTDDSPRIIDIPGGGKRFIGPPPSN